MVILIIFVIVFAALYFYDRKNTTSAWVCIAYLCGLTAFVFDIGRTIFNPVAFDVLAKAFLWLVSVAWTIGLCQHMKARIPVAPLLLIFLTGLAFLYWFSFVEPDIILRSIFSTSTAGLLLFCCLPALWTGRSNTTENVLLVVVSILCISYFLRPIIAYGLLAETYTAASYEGSVYAALLHSLSALLGLSLGITMTLVMGQKIVEKHFLASIRDPLTGLMNRRGLDQFVSSQLTEGAQSRRSILMIDLDHFKSINDRFGHDVGDEVLKRSASLLQTLTTGLGEIARIGGEEFLVILNDMAIEDRNTVAQHLRISLGMINHPELPEKERVTASLGLATLSPDETFAMTLRKADQCLYEAKAAGRNCVVIASEEDKASGLHLLQA